MGIFSRVRSFLSSVFNSSNNDRSRHPRSQRKPTFAHDNLYDTSTTQLINERWPSRGTTRSGFSPVNEASCHEKNAFPNCYSKPTSSSYNTSVSAQPRAASQNYSEQWPSSRSSSVSRQSESTLGNDYSYNISTRQLANERLSLRSTPRSAFNSANKASCLQEANAFPTSYSKPKPSSVSAQPRKATQSFTEQWPSRKLSPAVTSSYSAQAKSVCNVCTTKPSHQVCYARHFKYSVESSPKEGYVNCQTDTVYHNQWTKARAKLVDVDNNPRNISGSVELRSNSRTEFRNAQLENGILTFSMKASEAGIVATLQITIKRYSETYMITKDVNVIYNPSSSSLSELMVTEICTGNPRKRITLRLHIIDIFGNPAVINSQRNCDVKVDFSQYKPDDEDDEVSVEKQIHTQNGALCFDINVRANRPWSKDIVVLLNGQRLKQAEKFELSREEQQTLLRRRSAALQDYESFPSSIVYTSKGDNISAHLQIPSDVDDGKFQPFDDKLSQAKQLVGTGNYKVICKQTTKYVLMGPDYAHINNIKRALELKDRLPVEEESNQTSIIFRDCNMSLRDIRNCRDLILHLLRGSYYRKKASECARVRMEWKKVFNSLDEILNLFTCSSSTLSFCKYFKDYYGDLMNLYNREACEELFSFFNYNRDENEVDLHGLLVADEERLDGLKLELLSKDLSDKEIEDILRNVYRNQTYQGRRFSDVRMDLMRGSLTEEKVNEFVENCQTITNEKLERVRCDLVRRCNRSKDVDQIIEKWRQESDEAIRMLKRKLECFDLEKAVKNDSPWIEIIVGAGHHSRTKEKQNIRPKVEKFLKETGKKFTAVNKGSLVVTYKSYQGPEPCFGEYYCSRCDRCWKSSKSYKNKYQKCSRCNQKCWPVKQREKQKVVNYNQEGKDEKRESKPHQSHLCQRCTELGYPCNQDD